MALESIAELEHLKQQPEPTNRRRFTGSVAPLNWTIAVFLAVTSIAFTAMMVQYSLRHGRLIIIPTYDDVGYLSDGLMRVRQLHDGQVAEFVHQLTINPPHSPFSTVLAMLSFLIVGIHDCAPYLGNVVVIATLAAVVNYICQTLGVGQRMAIWLFVLTIPMAALAVEEFRPDVELAIVVAAGVLVTLHEPLSRSSTQHKIAIGALFGGAMLVKPPAFPATILMFGGSITLASVCDFLDDNRTKWKPLLRAWAISIATLVVVILPFYTFGGRREWNYFHAILFGRYRDIWQTKLSLASQLQYYLTGPGGSAMLGLHVYAIALLAALGLVLTLLRRDAERWRRLAVYVMLLAAYALVTVNQTKQIFFGLMFQVLLLLLAIITLRDLLHFQRRLTPRLPWATGILSLGVAAGILFFQWPVRNGNFNTDWVVNRNEIVYGVFNTIFDRCQSRPSVVLLTSTGDINPDVMCYLSLKQLAPLTFTRAGDDDTALVSRTEKFDWVDFVVASESGSTLTADFLPGNKLQDAVLAAIRTRDDFVQVGEFPFRKFGKSFFVFQRRDTFRGYEEVSGFGPHEGPYPQWKLPRVRWGLGPRSVLRFQVDKSGPMSINLSARTQVPGRAAVVKLNGHEIGRVTFNSVVTFDTFAIPFAATSGSHEIELEYSDWNNAKSGPPFAILFRKIVVEPKETAPSTRP